MKRLRILTLVSVLLATSIYCLKSENPTTIANGEGLIIDKDWLITNKNPQTPIEYIRPADQTFLTFPEWYLVFSPDEQAHYFKKHTSTSFPFMSHTAQIWESYGIVNDQIRGNYPYNGGYHLMIGVIGSSASAEYSIKSWYETIVGRVTDTYVVKTDEDKFNAKYTQDYVDFIKDKPWYEFDFKKRLVSLWSNTSFFGDNFFRKIERKYILTSELMVKWGYGKLIGLGSETVYDEAIPTTEVIVDSIPQNNLSLKIIKKYSDKSALISLPRYHKFTQAISDLALNGFSFKEIAGNNSAILVTVLVPSKTTVKMDYAQTVFTQPNSSNPKIKRVAIAVPIKDLSKLIVQLKKKNIEIEHIFDF